jgi:hypothetical protein
MTSTSASVQDDTSNSVTQDDRTKRKKLTSDVWDNFDKAEVMEVINGQTVSKCKAVCKFCHKQFNGESSMGTTHLRNHYKNKHGRERGQLLLNLARVGEDGILESYKYKEEVSAKKLLTAIVMHEYPFSIIEHEYFLEFIKSLQPAFPTKSRITIRKEILELYVEQKRNIYDMFGSFSCRMSATMDLWTSRQNKGYLCVTVHFIDDDWRIQKKNCKFHAFRRETYRVKSVSSISKEYD